LSDGKIVKYSEFYLTTVYPKIKDEKAISYVLIEDLSIGKKKEDEPSEKLDKITTAVNKVYPFTNLSPYSCKHLSIPIWTIQ
jgi:hypothetical protein